MARITTETLPRAPRARPSAPAASLVRPGDRPGDRPGEVVVFEAVVVDFFVSAADLLGVPKSVAAIYGAVFASPPPLSFAEIEARLSLSKGSVSQGLRVLREVGALREVSTTTDRAERFEPDIELRRLVERFLENRLAKQLAAGGDQLKRIAGTVPRGAGAETALLRRRLKQLQNWNTKARALLPLARTFLNLGG